METGHWILSGIATIMAGYFFIKWMHLRNALFRLSKEWIHCLKSDTNRVLPEVSADPACAGLVRELNGSLKELKAGRSDLEKQKRFFFNTIGNAAHDFKTPLAAALGYLQLAQSEEDPTKIAKDAAIARERLLRLNEISADLFDFARLQDPDHSLPLGPVPIARPLEEAVLALLPLFEQKGIEAKIELEDCVVLGNLQAIDQVFSNLLSNALKHSSENTLRIHVLSSGEVRFQNAFENLIWSDVEKVFERYYSVGQSSQSHGLGLGIARSLMEKMNGTLQVVMDHGQIAFICQFQTVSGVPKKTDAC